MDGTQTFTFTTNAPDAEGHYRYIAKAYYGNGTEAFSSHTANITLLHTKTLEITDFALTSDATVTADASNQFTSTFNVTVKNNGTIAQDAANVSVSITDADGNAYGTATTWTAANSQTVFMNPGGYTEGAKMAIYRWNDGDTDEQKEWAYFTEISEGFYSAELNGKSNFIICRVNPATAEADLDWNDNVYNQSGNLTTAGGNIFGNNGYNGSTLNLTQNTMGQLAVGVSTTLKVTVTTSAEEGGTFTFKAKENLSDSEYATAQTVEVTANAPKFAMYEGQNAIASGANVVYGTVKAPATVSKTFTIKNEGNAPLAITGYAYPNSYTVSPSFPNDGEEIAVGASKDYTLTLNPASFDFTRITDGFYDIDGNFTIGYTVNGVAKEFAVHFSGRAVAADTWTEDFASSIPAIWTVNNSNSDGWKWNEDRQTAYSGGVSGTFELITPRLAAANGEKLTYETKWQYTGGDDMTVQYSTDKKSWTNYATITASSETVKREFVAPAEGNYYLKFTANRYVNLDNFVGFTLNSNDCTLKEDGSGDAVAAGVYDNLTLDRQFVAGWNTVCLPFAISSVTGFFGEGAYAYDFTAYSDETGLTFSKVDALVAAKPYLVYVGTAITDPITLKNVEIAEANTSAGTTADGKVSFIGTYTPIAANTTLVGKYVVGNDPDKGSKIFKATDKTTMKGFRAYFNAGAGTRLSIVLNDETQGIRTIMAADEIAPEGVYNLNGQKVEQLKKGGLYIINGRKQVVK